MQRVKPMRNVKAIQKRNFSTKKQEWAEMCNDFFELEGEARMSFGEYVFIAFTALVLIVASISFMKLVGFLKACWLG